MATTLLLVAMFGQCGPGGCTIYRGGYAPQVMMPPPAAPQYLRQEVPVPVQVPVHHMKDAHGQDYIHQDAKILEKFIAERNTRFQAEDAARDEKGLLNGVLVNDLTATQVKGTLETNDPAFGARMHSPPGEEVPLPGGEGSPKTAPDQQTKYLYYTLGGLLFFLFLKSRAKQS